MKCLSAVAGFCPAEAPLVEHTTEWWKETYCTTCGREDRVKFDKINTSVRTALPPPSPPIKKKKKEREHY